MKFAFAPLVLAMVSCAGQGAHSDAAHGRKIMALQQKFDRFDYDASGDLTREEIEQGVRESDVTGVTSEDLNGLMEHYDVNKDGALSRWETQHAIDTPLPEDLHVDDHEGDHSH